MHTGATLGLPLPSSKSAGVIALGLLGRPWGQLCQPASHQVLLLWGYWMQLGLPGAAFANRHNRQKLNTWAGLRPATYNVSHPHSIVYNCTCSDRISDPTYVLGDWMRLATLVLDMGIRKSEQPVARAQQLCAVSLHLRGDVITRLHKDPIKPDLPTVFGYTHIHTHGSSMRCLRIVD